MNAFEAYLRGLSHVISAFGLVLLLWFAQLLLTLPAAVAVSDAVHQDIRHGAAADTLQQSFDLEWHSEYEDRSSGLAATFEPRHLLGVAPQLSNLEGWLEGELLRAEGSGALFLAALALAHGILWTFLLGGFLTRISDRSEAHGLSEFAAACGRTFGPLLRLTILSAPLYWLIYQLGDRLDGLVKRWTTDVTAETTALAWYLPTVLVVAALLLLVQLLFDYAKVAVVEERTGTFGALRAAVSTLLQRPLATAGLGILHALAFATLLGLWHLLGPSPGVSGWGAALLAFAAAQLYVVLRLGLRLTRIAAQLELLRATRGLRF